VSGRGERRLLRSLMFPARQHLVGQVESARPASCRVGEVIGAHRAGLGGLRRLRPPDLIGPAPQPPAECHRQQNAGDVAEPAHHDVVGDPLARLRVVEAHRPRRDVAVADRLHIVVQVEAERSALIGALVEDALVGLAGLLAVVLQVRGRRQAVDGAHLVDAGADDLVPPLLRRQLLLRLALAQLGQLGGVGRLRAQLQQGDGGPFLAAGVGLAQEGAQAAERLIRSFRKPFVLGLRVELHPFGREA
jgi:hypothetical protein